MTRRPPRSTLFPYTPPSRSRAKPGPPPPTQHKPLPHRRRQQRSAEHVAVDLIHVAEIATQSLKAPVLPRRPDDVLPVERAPANRRDREDHVAQQDLAAAPDTLQALQDELIRDRRLGDLGAIEQAAPPVLQQHQRGRAVFAHQSEPAVLYVEGRRAARDRVRGRPGDTPAEIATQRRGVELGEDAAV